MFQIFSNYCKIVHFGVNFNIIVYNLLNMNHILDLSIRDYYTFMNDFGVICENLKLINYNQINSQSQ